MMIMNVFPIGFFFTKGDFVPVATPRSDDAAQTRNFPTIGARKEAEISREHSLDIPFYAYRFF